MQKKPPQSIKSLAARSTTMSAATAAAIAAKPEPVTVAAASAPYPEELNQIARHVLTQQAIFPPSHMPHDGLQLSIDEARAIDHANYLIHWRPQSGIPEINQYAIATEVLSPRSAKKPN